MSPVIISRRPIAAITMSARFTCAARSVVREWQIVTVASPPAPGRSRSAAMGRPTIVLRPITTACAPRVSTPLRSSSSRTPIGVHGTNPLRSPL